MYDISRDDWDTAWCSQEAWTALWRGLRPQFDAQQWQDVLAFLRNCALARGSDNPNARVLMHKAWLALFREIDGPLAFVLVHHDGAVSLSHTRRTVNNVPAYAATLARKAKATVYVIPQDSSTAKWSVSSIKNKPAAAAIRFSARRATCTGDVI